MLRLVAIALYQAQRPKLFIWLHSVVIILIFSDK